MGFSACCSLPRALLFILARGALDVLREGPLMSQKALILLGRLLFQTAAIQVAWPVVWDLPGSAHQAQLLVVPANEPLPQLSRLYTYTS